MNDSNQSMSEQRAETVAELIGNCSECGERKMLYNNGMCSVCLLEILRGDCRGCHETGILLDTGVCMDCAREALREMTDLIKSYTERVR